MTDPRAARDRGVSLAQPELSVELGPLRLRHPLINACGTMEIFELADALGEGFLTNPPVAAYVPKTITLEARAGNPPPRVLETPAGMINSIGLPSEGVDDFVGRDLPHLLSLPCPLILSVGGFSVEEYSSLTRALRRALDETGSGWIGRVGLEANISCPNVHSGCASIGGDPRQTAEVVAAMRDAWPGLLITKLSPNVADICTIAEAAVNAGTDAIAAVNTFKALVIDRRTLRPYLGNTFGGLSGPAIRPLALRAVFELFAAVDVPIIGMGGVSTVEDVVDFLACGARVVAVGSAGLSDPWRTQDLADDLREALVALGLRLNELVGRAHAEPK